MEEIKVLLADDDQEILQSMEKSITRQGFTVVTASDGEEAWEKIGQDDPDVILLDLTMPKMDGFAVLKKLRESPPTRKWQPVIIVSGRTELDDMRQGFSLEADHYLTKPCSMEAIIKAIRLMLRLIPQRRSSEEMTREEHK